MILVTGGAGFIGSHVTDKLLEMGESVISIDNFNDFYKPDIKRKNIQHNLEKENFKLVEVDITNKERLKAIFKENDINKVIHLAAMAGVRPSIENPYIYEEINIRGTLNLLEIVRDCGIENFVFGSSSSVYGASDVVPFIENNRADRPISPYAASKRSCELFCYTYSHLFDIPMSCLRFFTVYGPRQRPEMAIHKFARLIDQGKEIEMYGDGKSKRDYTFVSDIVNGIVSVLGKKFKYEIFNLGNSKTVELRYLISLIEKNIGKEANIKQMPDQPGDVPITYADVSKSNKLFGYEPKVSIEEGIRRFIEWYGNNKP
ncbi:MAG: GDP-mannose 4,6-dehydratase [Candidatus Aenigmarchaeota archaeon]|nr:GDP-mannose 4,6-dehydratase [Candidatus Aenigmarchaeota archaeon]